MDIFLGMLECAKQADKSTKNACIELGRFSLAEVEKVEWEVLSTT